MHAYRDGFIQAGGHWFHYLDWGTPDQPPVVLCHGTTGNAHGWDRVSAALAAEGYRVLALDARNHGDSDWLDEPLNSSILAADLLGIIDGLGLDGIGLVGHSMGGRQAMTFAVEHPARLRWLVIEDIAPTAPPTGSRRVADFLSALPPSWPSHQAYVDQALRPSMRHAPEEDLRWRALHSLRPLPGGRYQLKYYRPETAGTASAAAPPNDLWERLPVVDCPTLLLWGDESDIVDQELARRMVAVMPDCREVEIPRAGHSIHTDNAPDFIAELLRFATEVDRP